jgi:hypothetical protein
MFLPYSSSLSFSLLNDVPNWKELVPKKEIIAMKLSRLL